MKPLVQIAESLKIVTHDVTHLAYTKPELEAKLHDNDF
jgi:hypothetical protein